MSIQKEKFSGNALLSFFPIFYWITALQEVATVELKEVLNAPFLIINFYIVFRFIYLFLLYYFTIKNKRFKIWILAFLVLYLLVLIIDLTQGSTDYRTHSQVIPYLIGASGLLITIFFYFLEVVNSKKDATHNILFWISIAFFIYFTTFSVFKLVQNHLLYTNYFSGLLFFLLIISFLFNIILIVGLLISEPPKQKQEKFILESD